MADRQIPTMDDLPDAGVLDGIVETLGTQATLNTAESAALTAIKGAVTTALTGIGALSTAAQIGTALAALSTAVGAVTIP